MKCALVFFSEMLMKETDFDPVPSTEGPGPSSAGFMCLRNAIYHRLSNIFFSSNILSINSIKWVLCP